jgi:hypothetical protein
MATIVKHVVMRDADKKTWTSAFGHAHDGKDCKVLRALTHDDAEFAKEWDVAIGKHVVELADGTRGVVLNDEVK